MLRVGSRENVSAVDRRVWHPSSGRCVPPNALLARGCPYFNLRVLNESMHPEALAKTSGCWNFPVFAHAGGGADEPFNSDIGAWLPIALCGRTSL